MEVLHLPDSAAFAKSNFRWFYANGLALRNRSDHVIRGTQKRTVNNAFHGACTTIQPNIISMIRNPRRQ